MKIYGVNRGTTVFVYGMCTYLGPRLVILIPPTSVYDWFFILNEMRNASNNAEMKVEKPDEIFQLLLLETFLVSSIVLLLTYNASKELQHSSCNLFYFSWR